MEKDLVFTPSQRVILVMAGLFIVMGGFKVAADLIVPMLLSLFIAMACNPLVRRLVSWRIPRGVSVMVVILLLVMVVAAVGGLVSSSLSDFKAQLPTYQEQLKDQMGGLQVWLANFGVETSFAGLREHVNPGTIMGFASNILSGVGNALTNTFLILFTVIFMLLEAKSIGPKLHIALDDPQMKVKRIDAFLESINSYLSIKTVVSLGTGFCAGLLTYVMGLDHVALWAVLAFMLNYIPNVGSIIAAAPPVLLALVQGGPVDAGIIAVGYVAINTVMGNVIEPKIMGKGLGLSTLVVFLSLVYWGWLLGTVGMLLSVPLTMLIKTALDASDDASWLSVLLSSPEQAAEYAKAQRR